MAAIEAQAPVGRLVRCSAAMGWAARAPRFTGGLGGVAACGPGSGQGSGRRGRFCERLLGGSRGVSVAGVAGVAGTEQCTLAQALRET